MELVPAYVASLANSGHTRSEIPSLLKLASTDFPTSIRVTALCTLGYFGEEALSAIPKIQHLLKDPDENVRMMAAQAILFISRDQQQLDELSDALGKTGQERIAFQGRGQEVLDEARAEADALSSLLGDDSDALGAEVQGRVDSFVEGYVRMNLEGNGYQRRNVLRQMRDCDSDLSRFGPDVRKLIDDPDNETRQLARQVSRLIEQQKVR